jgi:hypothetical protein
VRRACPEAWKALRVRLRAIGEVVAQDARADASYSTRIPQTIKVRVTSGGNVKVVMGGDAAPDAVPIENKGKGFVRHPTFGKRGAGDWTSKNSHPAILLPAFAKRADWALEEMERAYMDTFIRVFEGR